MPIKRPADELPCANCKSWPRMRPGCSYCRRCERDRQRESRKRNTIQGHGMYSWRARARRP